MVEEDDVFAAGAPTKMQRSLKYMEDIVSVEPKRISRK